MVRTSVALLLLSFFAGCTYPDFQNPLVAPAEAIGFPELTGTYQSKHPETGELSWLHVGSASNEFPDGFHKLIWVMPTPERGLESIEYLCFFYKVDDSYILHLPTVEGGHLDSQCRGTHSARQLLGIQFC